MCTYCIVGITVEPLIKATPDHDMRTPLYKGHLLSLKCTLLVQNNP